MDPMTGDKPTSEVPDLGQELRSRGLRVTPQRRAIFGAFSGAVTEHLSADEVHARASAAVPELSRGTVYATLAELTELGLLAAVGSPEPVRYETNARHHQHFRCRICLRLYDVDLENPADDHLRRDGFAPERLSITVEGICADCAQYESGLRSGAARAREDEPSELPRGLAGLEVESPVGPVLMGATPKGLVRVIFDNHADAPQLRAIARRRKGGAAARRHLVEGQAFVEAFFADQPTRDCVVDWEAIDNRSVATLQAVQMMRPGLECSYDTLRTPAGARDRGLALGTNPLAIVVPCHRVTRGREIPDAYVGGADRKRELLRVTGH